MLDRTADKGPEGPAAPQPPPGGALEARALVVSAGGAPRLCGVSLRAPRGAVTAVVGPNGAGKTLLLRALHGLETPDAGGVFWDGRPLDAEARARQAMLFQRPVMLRRTAAANLDFALRLRGWRGADLRERRDALLAELGLSGLQASPARRLSGGEQQRLALARALAGDPAVLMLDEPAASLDPDATARIEAVVDQRRAAGAAILLVTHDMGQVRRLADSVVFLHQGHVMEHTPAAQFLERPSSEAARAHKAGRLLLAAGSAV